MGLPKEKERREPKARPKPSAPPRAYLGEVRGILFLALALFLGLALFSYSPADPSINSTGTPSAIHNMGGLSGACAADGLISLMGLASYLVVLVFLVLGFGSFREGSTFKVSQIFLLLFFLAMASVLCQLQWQNVPLAGE